MDDKSKEDMQQFRIDIQQFRIDIIQDIRAKNNILWMNILRIAMQKSPQETGKILSEIQNNDKRITEITKEICDEELSKT